MPTEGAPPDTAANAYSSWTSFPEGLQTVENCTYCPVMAAVCVARGEANAPLRL